MTMSVEDEDEPVAPVAAGDLPRETLPPADLEERIVAVLLARKLLKPGPRLSYPRLVMLGGMAAILALGIGIGVLLARPQPRDDRFVLFLYATPSSENGDEASRAREYGAWARDLRSRGVPIRGEKLADGAETLGPAGPGADPVAGYFVLGVKESREALAVAESCPHLRHGGRIEVRRIESR